MNDLDRFHLAVDVIDRVPQLSPMAAYAKQAVRDKLIEQKQYIAKYGEDLPEIRKLEKRRSEIPGRPCNASRSCRCPPCVES